MIQELQQVLLKKTKQNISFKLYLFHSGIVRWQPTLTNLNKNSAKAALKFLKKSKPRGGTNILQALEVIRQERKKIDTVYLLSDGIDPYLQYQIDKLSFKKVRINSIAFLINGSNTKVESDAKKLLYDLSRKTAGTFRVIE